jgi:hypothetical protein
MVFSQAKLIRARENGNHKEAQILLNRISKVQNQLPLWKEKLEMVKAVVEAAVNSPAAALALIRDAENEGTPELENP